MVALRRFAAISKRFERPSTAAVARMRASRTASSSTESPVASVTRPGVGPRYSESSFRRSSDSSKDSGNAISSRGTDCSRELVFEVSFDRGRSLVAPRPPVATVEALDDTAA